MLKLLLIIIFFPVIIGAPIVLIGLLISFIQDRSYSGTSYSSSSSASSGAPDANTELLKNMAANLSSGSSGTSSSYGGGSYDDRGAEDEEDEKEYYDQDETYGRIPLEKLPDAFTFLDDPDRIYMHYYYGTGGLGQKVRIYKEGADGRQVSISWALNGTLVGREFTTDQGKIVKYY